MHGNKSSINLQCLSKVFFFPLCFISDPHGAQSDTFSRGSGSLEQYVCYLVNICVSMCEPITAQVPPSHLGTCWSPVRAPSDPVCEGRTNLTGDTPSLIKLK